MKICFQILSLNVPGGAERVMTLLASGMAERGHDVSVVCLSREGKGTFYPLSDKVHVHYLETWDTEHALLRNKRLRTWFRIYLMYRALRALKPDISVSFLTDMTIYSAWAARWAGIPHISAERNSPWDSPGQEEKRRRRDRAFAISTGRVVQTEAIRAYFEETIGKTSEVIANPVQLMCSPCPAGTEREYRIVSVGRLVAQKNYRLLLNGFAHFHSLFPNYRLEIYGQNFGMRRELEALAETIGIRGHVVFCEPVQDLHRRIRNAAVFVMTSEYEGYPNSLAEAVALGIPSIAVDCRSKGSASIVCDGQRGILLPPNDPEALKDALVLLTQRQDIAAQYSKAGIEFGRAAGTAQYVDAWERYLRGVGSCWIRRKGFTKYARHPND